MFRYPYDLYVHHEKIDDRSSECKTYPNPATGQLNIELPLSSQNARLQMFDVAGRLVLAKTLQNGKNSLDISEFPRGLYFLWLSADGNRKFEVKKLVVN
jgi:hypothetical protein